MKPELIRLKAFGPYLKDTVCDFRELYASGLFLITGSTGSGKTTLLDGMSFALYGSATGGQRSFRDMRSLSCDPAEDTEVEFIFKFFDARFRFIRRMKLHKKRSGEIDERIEAECYKEKNGDWELLMSGNEAVRKKAAELLGFTHSQFSQVIVLPQGEFRKLLLAPSNEKAEILRVLFSTDRWQAVTDAMSARLKSVEAVLGDARKEREARLSAIGMANEDALTFALKEKQEELSLTNLQAQEANAAREKASSDYRNAERIGEMFSQLGQIELELTEIANKKGEHTALEEKVQLASKARVVMPTYKSLLQQRADFAVLRKSFTAAEEKKQLAAATLKEAQERAELLPGYKAKTDERAGELKQLELLLPNVQRFAELEKEIDVQKRRHFLCTENIKKEQEVFQETEARLQKGQQVITELHQTKIAPLPEWQKEQHQLQNQKRVYAQLLTAKEKSQANGQTIFTLDGEISVLHQTLLEAKDRYNRLKKAFFADMAYTLASELGDGEPCPVCGSVHHPALQKQSGDSDKAALETAEKAASEAEKNLVKVQTQKALLVEQQTALQGEIGALETECAGWQTVEQLNIRLNELASLLGAVPEAELNFKKYEDGLNKLKEKKVGAEQELQVMTQKEGAIAAALELLISQKETLAAEIGDCPDIETLTSNITIKKQELDELKALSERIIAELNASVLANSAAEQNWTFQKNALSDCGKRLDKNTASYETALAKEELPSGIDLIAAALPDEEYQSLSEELSRIKAKISDLSRQKEQLQTELAEKEKPDLEQEKAVLEVQNKKADELNQRVGGLTADAELLTSTVIAIEQLKLKNNELEQQYGKLAVLSAVMSGRNSKKTSLHNFVLGLMLDDVTECASRYLDSFSRGRYRLVRAEDSSGNGLKGLDIDAEDSYVGGVRRVCTLSGGEVFLASLSLAFGLAEVVQSLSGGTSLEAIFIDEGFGTLDSETLELAMRALLDIQRQGRFVGIISHVSELKARIPARIEVTGGNTGSVLTIMGAENDG